MKTLLQILLLTWPLLFFGWVILSLYLNYRKIPNRTITFKYYIDGKPEWKIFNFFGEIYLVVMFAILIYYICEFIKTNFL